MDRPPKMLVTGLSGLIGSRLSRRLAGEWELIGLDLDSGVDLTRPGTLDAVAGAHPDALAMVHLAAFTDVNAAHEQSDQLGAACFMINVIGTQHVVEFCRARQLPLIHISTDYVFDGRKREAYTETDATRPIEWYGRTKLLAEQAALAWPRATALRIAFPYAPPPAPKADLVRAMIGGMAAGRELNLFDDQVITPTWADDVAEAVGLVARRPAPGEIFHVTGGGSTTPHELGLKIAETFGFDPALARATKLADSQTPGARPRQERLEMSNAKWAAYAREHAVAPPLGIDEGLRRMRDAMKS